MRWKNWLKRYAVFIVGILINSFGISFITKAALGTSPISSVPYVLSLEFPLTLGVFTFIMNMGFILLQILLLRRKFPKIQLLQILVNLLFSWFIDVSMTILQFLNPVHYFVRLVCLLVGCFILAFGISVEVAPNVLMVPGEGLVKAISQVLHREFGSVKVCFDVTLMATSLILSLIFFHGLNGIREGTVISAVLVGLIVKWFNRHLGFLRRITAWGVPSLNVPEERAADREQKSLTLHKAQC